MLLDWLRNLKLSPTYGRMDWQTDWHGWVLEMLVHLKTDQGFWLPKCDPIMNSDLAQWDGILASLIGGNCWTLWLLREQPLINFGFLCSNYKPILSQLQPKKGAKLRTWCWIWRRYSTSIVWNKVFLTRLQEVLEYYSAIDKNLFCTVFTVFR